MSTLVLYYSMAGSTKAEAERIALERKADLEPVIEKRRRTFFTAFLPGCPMAMHRKASAIQPLRANLADYERVVLCAPVYAGYPAPAFNAMLNLLPEGKEVEIVLCSSGGETPNSIVGTKEAVLNRGCRLISYRDVRTGKVPGEEK